MESQIPSRRYKLCLIISFTWLLCFLILVGRIPTQSFTKRAFSSEKWIVVTSISSPTEQIQKLVNLQGWTLLVIADLKTPKNWTYPGVIFLSTEAQAQLGYEIFDHIPWNSYTRKMIGYLFAIEHGAIVIYDTDDDNCPDSFKGFEKSFVFNKEKRMGGLVVLNESTLTHMKNPYPHFGQETIWPRGYPLELIGEKDNNTYRTCRVQVPSIQQGITNGDHDVTGKKVPMNVTFDPVAPPLIYSEGVMAPFNSQNTIFLYDAFWAMMLPISVAFPVTDIWRGYWAQPLLWLLGEHLGFFAANTTQIRNAHNYLRDFAEEKQLYNQTGSLIKFLVSWKCNGETYFGKCIIQLTQDMANSGFWSEEEVGLAKAWVKDLNRIGYKLNPRVSNDDNEDRGPCLNTENPTHVIFNPAQPTDPDRRTLKGLCKSVDHPMTRVTHYTTTDGTNTITTESNEEMFTASFFPKTLLVVTFNHAHYKNIWLLDLIYRPHFPNILYCGNFPNTSILANLYSKEKWIHAGVNKISLIHAEVCKGFFSYECGLRAIEMNYGVEDYIVLSDDILFKFWELGDYPVTDAWGFQLSLERLFNTDLDSNHTMHRWLWWNTRWGKNATRKSLQTIYREAQDGNKLLQEFVANRERYGLNISTTSFVVGDFYHFSKDQEELFYEAGWIFRNNNVFLEIVVPNLLFGISLPTTELRSLPGSYVWEDDREYPFAYFEDYEKRIIFHPVKLQQTLNKKELWTDYCRYYVSDLLRVYHEGIIKKYN